MFVLSAVLGTEWREPVHVESRTRQIKNTIKESSSARRNAAHAIIDVSKFPLLG